MHSDYAKALGLPTDREQAEQARRKRLWRNIQTYGTAHPPRQCLTMQLMAQEQQSQGASLNLAISDQSETPSADELDKRQAIDIDRLTWPAKASDHGPLAEMLAEHFLKFPRRPPSHRAKIFRSLDRALAWVREF